MKQGFTIWLTGMSGAGKSTISGELLRILAARGPRKVELLDGDIVREYLSKGLTFSKEDRDTNVRRIGFVADLLARNDVIAVTAAISPYREVRQEVRALHKANNFLEVHVSVSLDKLVERDVKGLYKKALAGEIPNFTGVSDPYEAPEKPEVVVYTGGEETVAQSAAKVIRAAELLGFLEPSLVGVQALTPALEAEVRETLGLAGRQVP
jgi:adenylyl-sulfate kinase